MAWDTTTLADVVGCQLLIHLLTLSAHISLVKSTSATTTSKLAIVVISTTSLMIIILLTSLRLLEATLLLLIILLRLNSRVALNLGILLGVRVDNDTVLKSWITGYELVFSQFSACLLVEKGRFYLGIKTLSFDDLV
jgi:hypothetical protein